MTGGLGYLGSFVAPILAGRGFEVVVLDTGFFKDATLTPPPVVNLVSKDVRDVSEDDLTGFDVVLHLAGISNDPFGNLSEDEIYRPTRIYARSIAEICKKKKIRFVFASSCSVYGKGGDSVLDEESPANPQTPYSRNKLEIEEDLAALAGGSFSPIALRFATVFGVSPRMRFDIIINMFVGMATTEGKITLNSDGSVWRPNIYIADVAEAFYSALLFRERVPALLTLNVGREENNMRVLDIAKTVGEEVENCPIRFLKDSKRGDELIKSRVLHGTRDTRDYKVSFEKIKKVFPRFSCRYSVRDGVREMAKALREIPLTRRLFKDPKFYRLQTIEGLLQDGKIGRDLRWTHTK